MNRALQLPVYAGSAFQMRGRLTLLDQLLTQADVASLQYEVWRHFETAPDVQTDAGTLSVAASVFDTPLPGGDNVAYDVPSTGVVDEGAYHIKTLFTLTGGSSGFLMSEARFLHAPS